MKLVRNFRDIDFCKPKVIQGLDLSAKKRKENQSDS